jgi:hypothetical protein
MSQSTLYLLNGPVIGFIDLSLQKQDVTPLLVTMPASWNKPRTIVRIKIVGDFQLAAAGDVFTRKLWLGKTQLTFCSEQQEVPNQGRNFHDQHDFVLYGDNLHAIHSTHHTGIGPTTYFVPSEGGARSEQNRNAVPATCEVSRSDAPIIVDDDWNKLSISFYGFAPTTQKIAYSIRQFTVEQIEL